MKLIKDNLIPTLIILLASAAVIFAALPIADTTWAEGIRNGPGEEERGEEGFGEEGERRGERPGGVAMIFLPLIKVSILMGIGGLLTALILWIIRVTRKIFSKRPRLPQNST